MISKFPEFKKLELSDEKEITDILNREKLPPYADFHFVNLWIWNTSDKILISILNDNLVIIFGEYVSSNYSKDVPFISFIGTNKVVKTAIALMQFSKEKYGVSSLRLIPEEIALELANNGFTKKEDRDSDDYVYLVSDLVNIHLQKRSTKDKNIRRFIKSHPSYEISKISIADLDDDSLRNELKIFFLKWGKGKDVGEFNDIEYKAFERLLQLIDKNIYIVLLYTEGFLCGFTIYEAILGTEYALSHFAKADISYDSKIYDILNWEEARILEKSGIKYYNWEQDLGIPGLRYAKMKYKPACFLKKFIISLT